jgi:ABC-type uncharacterized transport system permease subunit
MQGQLKLNNTVTVKLEKRMSVSKSISIFTLVISLLLAFLLGALIIRFSGFNPLEVYKMMFAGAFTTSYGISETIVKAIPLLLAGLGVSIAFRMLLWNIGAEGQLYMGAFAATWVALTFPNLPRVILLVLLVIAGFLGGALWNLIPALTRAYMGVNEIITTLMFNYIANFWIGYLVFGPWKDPEGFNQPFTAKFDQNVMLPTLAGTRIHFGLLLGLIAAILIFVTLNHTRWGYEIRVTGENENAAQYGGINIRKNIILVMCLSGGLAGVAGMAEVTGVLGRLQQGFSPGYGNTAILIAVLAKFHPLAIIVVSFLFGGLLVGGYTVQTIGVPTSIIFILQGAILFFVLAGEFVTKHRLRFERR